MKKGFLAILAVVVTVLALVIPMGTPVLAGPGVPPGASFSATLLTFLVDSQVSGDRNISLTIVNPDTTVAIVPSATHVVAGGTVNLYVIEKNTGTAALTSTHVVLTSTAGLNVYLTKASGTFTGGDSGVVNVLDVGETWSWTVTGVVVNSSTTFTAIGHGLDSLGHDITYSAYPNEQATATVNIASTVTSLVPNTGAQGATLTAVQINGTNLTGATTVNFSGRGVTASNVTVINATQITVNIAITGGAAVGARDVTVSTPGGTSAALVGGFTVVFGLPPTVTVSIGAPTTVHIGDTFDVNINVSGVTGLASWQFDLLYVNSIVQVIGVQGGTGVTTGLVETTIMPVDAWNSVPGNFGNPVTGNVIRVIGHIQAPGSVIGSGYMAKIHFTVLGTAGTFSPLHLLNVGLFDDNAQTIAVTTIDALTSVVEPAALFPGDANGDGLVNMGDATKVMRIILGLDSLTVGADVNGDGVVNMGDVTKIELIILGLN